MNLPQTLRAQLTSFSHPKFDLSSRLHDVPYASGVSILVPVEAQQGEDELALVRHVASALDPICGSHFSLTAPLHAFLDLKFLETHVKDPTVEFVLLSKSTPNGALQDIAGITPRGILEMAVTQEAFQDLGIPGKRSKSAHGEVYYVSVDMMAKSFRPGKPLYDKVLRSLLRNPVPLNFTCACAKNGRPVTPLFPRGVVNVTPHTHRATHFVTASILPPCATLQRLFTAEVDSGAHTHEPMIDSCAREAQHPADRAGQSAKAPFPGVTGSVENTEHSVSRAELTRHALGALYDWMGMLQGDSAPVSTALSGELKEAFSLLEDPSAAWCTGEVHHLRIQGLITPQQIETVFEALRNKGLFVDSWIPVSVWGQLVWPRDHAGKRKPQSNAACSMNSTFIVFEEDVLHFTAF